MRQMVIAGNWKMNCTRAEAKSLVGGLRAELDARDYEAQIIVCPPFTALSMVGELLEGSRIALGAQDMFWKEKGAYTGQVSPRMLLDSGCRYVIVGHSEPRGRFGVPEPDFSPELLAYFGDNDTVVNRKLLAAFQAGLKPILCIGETLAERHAGQTDSVVAHQIEAAVQGVTEPQAAALILAYEPVWAIGTGEVCAAEEADRVCGVVRQTIGRLFGADAAAAVRVQYGGSVKPDNAEDLLARPNIDGALVGGASLKASDFSTIVAASPKSK